MPATPNLPTPNFTFNPNAPGACIAGVRPYRSGSYRLDAETISGKFIVHNYGHGGAGITLSWGCAAKVRAMRWLRLSEQNFRVDKWSLCRQPHETTIGVVGS